MNNKDSWSWRDAASALTGPFLLLLVMIATYVTLISIDRRKTQTFHCGISEDRAMKKVLALCPERKARIFEVTPVMCLDIDGSVGEALTIRYKCSK